MPTFKQCACCRGLKHVRYFSRDRSRRDGLCCRCKACESERQRLIYRRRRVATRGQCVRMIFSENSRRIRDATK